MKFLRRNYRILLLAFGLLWRPQILYGVRMHILFPIQKIIASPPSFQRTSFLDKRSDGCSDDEGCTTEDESEYYASEENASDGCSDDSCAEPAEESTSEPSDGCEDAGSCETTTENRETVSYEDDGCSCTGEGVVGSPVTGNPIDRTLLIRVTLTQSADLQLTIQSPSGALLRSLFSGTMDAGESVWEWNGQTEDGSWISDGVYRCELEINRQRTLSHSFSYSQTDGFITDSGHVLIFDVLPRTMTQLRP